MAYVESWVESDPDGSIVRISGMDDAVRTAKRAVRERLEGDASALLTGIYDSFSAGTIKMGSGRIHAVLAAGLGALALQDGRMAFTTDTHKLYHLDDGGIIEIGYASIASPTFTGTVAISGDLTITGNGAINGGSLAVLGTGVNGQLTLQRATNHQWRLLADNSNAFSLTDVTSGVTVITATSAGAVTLASTLGVTGLITGSAGLTLTGVLTMTSANSVIVPGATGFFIKNHANSAVNLTVLDGGDVSIGGTLVVTGTLTTGNSTTTQLQVNGPIIGTQKITTTGATNGDGIGYAGGAGGTATQSTSKSTAVVFSSNVTCGQITMNGAALAAGAIVSFAVSNTAFLPNDIVLLNHVSGGTPGAYSLNARATTNSATIDVRNNTAGSLSEAIVVQFAIFRTVTS